MKRLIAFLLALTGMICCAGCTAGRTPASMINFYYCTNEISYQGTDGVITFEQRAVEHSDDDLISTLNLYLKGPLHDELRSPFPEDTKIESLTSDSDTIYLIVSKPLSSLSGLELTLACACLCKTVLEIMPQQTVQIECLDELLDGNPAITMDNDSLVWLDVAVTTPTTEP